MSVEENQLPHHPVVPKNKGGRPRKDSKQKKSITLDEAVNGLPENVSLSIEIDWIRAHPALRRKAATNGEVFLLVDDVIAITTGPCQHPVAPSKSAVNALHYFANHPAELIRTLMGGIKKGSGAGPAGLPIEEEEKDPDVAQLEKYLDEIRE